jgi:F-type H+-transporting ATPase subunit gamma
MANLKEIRTRISSVKTTRQVTSAMKMVSAAKLKKAQDAILQIRPYAEKLSEVLSSLSANLEMEERSVYTQNRVPEKVLIIAISSNRGLCGAFNSNIAKKAIDLARKKYDKQLKNGKVDFWAIGKQGEKMLRSYRMPVAGSTNELFDNLTFNTANIFVSGVMEEFIRGNYDRVELVYNKFINAASQEQVAEQFLPIVAQKKDRKKVVNLNYLFEPSIESIVEDLIPRSLKIQFYKAMLDSNAAEHGARMTSMHKATDNATELIRELTLTFNKARQAAITNEILEVTNGAEALNG